MAESKFHPLLVGQREYPEYLARAGEYTDRYKGAYPPWLHVEWGDEATVYLDEARESLELLTDPAAAAFQIVDFIRLAYPKIRYLHCYLHIE